MNPKSTYATYYDVLADIHRQLAPARYLEIGVHKGFSLAFVQPGTQVVAVDPQPILENDAPLDTSVLPTTSDDFFANPTFAAHRDQFDLVFVDGLHLFEQALTDVLNAEALCGPNSVILVHDVMPIDEATSTRERNTLVWSGDVWKAILALRTHRPDLAIHTLDAQPTGIAVITGFSGESVDRSWFPHAVDELMPQTYADLMALGAEHALNLVPSSSDQLQRLLPAHAG